MLANARDAQTLQPVLASPLRVTVEQDIVPRVPQKPPQNVMAVTKAKKAIRKASRQVKATWYCLTGRSRCTIGHLGGMFAAASPDLHLNGKTINVCYLGHCAKVRIIDCLCSRPGGLDLYSDAFRMLAPLSVGAIMVTIE